VPPFVGHDDPPSLPSVHSEGVCYQVGFTQRGGFVRQYLASPVRDALLPTFEMKEVPRHTPSIQLGPQGSGDPVSIASYRKAAGVPRRGGGRIWRVVVTNEWGHEITEIPVALEPEGSLRHAHSATMAWRATQIALDVLEVRRAPRSWSQSSKGPATFGGHDLALLHRDRNGRETQGGLVDG
jgi:hypothetical protein